MKTTCSKGLAHEVDQQAVKAGWISQLSPFRQQRVSEQQFRLLADHFVLIILAEAFLQLLENLMIGIEFEDAPLFRAAAFALEQQPLQLRAVVHLRAYQTGGRSHQAGP